jgi:hypothetical protein
VNNVDATFNFDTSLYFTDIDKNDNLTFSGKNLPSGLEISAQGVLTAQQQLRVAIVLK